MDKALLEKIEKLKKEKDVVILAHYYVDGQVQDIADFVGDSFALAKKASQVTQANILFCGVKFMGESAKVLNPEKTVAMPDIYADCPMAHMATVEKIKEAKAKYDDLAVVCYVNSTEEIKEYSDVCVTSSNAQKVVGNLKEKNIYFVPDENLARYIAKFMPEKNFIFNDGFCHVHKALTVEDVAKAREDHPDALILAHPECVMATLDLVDYIGSTKQIIEYATASDKKEFVIFSEMGVLHELEKRNPDKKFYLSSHDQICPNMKKVTIDNVVTALERFNTPDIAETEIVLTPSQVEAAKTPLKRMLELS